MSQDGVPLAVDSLRCHVRSLKSVHRSSLPENYEAVTLLPFKGSPIRRGDPECLPAFLEILTGA
jgi:hypothetical protein